MSTSPVVLLHTNKPADTEAKVREHHPDLSIHTCDSYAALPSMLDSTAAEVVYSVRFAGTPDFPREALLSAKQVKWISVGGSGTDHLQPWDINNIQVTNAAGVAADMMAEYVLGCLLSFRLSLRDFHQAQNESRWIAGQVSPIKGSTALLLGLGKTGCAVAKVFKSMGIQVLGTRARPEDTPCVDEVHGPDNLYQLLPRADVIVCTLPLLESTRSILSSTHFALLRSHCILIDVSRGGVVDETALLNALNNKQLAGAALDVFSHEPLPEDHPFWQMQNVIVTPHCSSVYAGWELNSAEMFAHNLARYRRGQTLHNVVDPTRGY